MAKKPSSAAYQHTPAAYRLLVPAAMLVLVFALTSQQKVVAARADADTLKEVGQRETAAHELQLAHEIVEKARSKAAAAKTQLDDFVARHFEEHRLRGAAPLPKFRESQPARKGVVNPQWEQIDKQLTELKTHREDLLGRLTPAHPEIVEIDDRIARLSQKLELERPFAEELPPSGGVEAVDAADLNLAEYLNSEKHRHRKSASEFEEVFARWQAAERELQAALETERQAAQRLAEMKSPVAPAAAARPSVAPPSPVRAPSAPLPPVNPQQPSSQPLVLAALLIASVVTAIAAVKLVRSSSGAVFANAAEVSAVLALPVVGIVPAAEIASDTRPAAARVRRATLLMAEVLLAVLVFAAVAYLVQDPSFLWRLCTDPWEGVGGMMRFFGAN